MAGINKTGEACQRRWALLKEAKAQLRDLSLDSIVLIKAHEFDKDLLKLCQKTLVFTSARDVADIGSSKLRSGFVANVRQQKPQELVSAIAAGLGKDIEEHMCWRHHAPLNVNVLYEDTIKCGWYLLRIFAAIAHSLPEAMVPIEGATSLDLAGFNEWCQVHDMNPQINGSPRRGDLAFGLDVAQALRHQFHWWQALHKWPTGRSLQMQSRKNTSAMLES
jgi:hypothetical protein